MPRWQDVGFSCGHVKAEMPLGYLGRDVKQAGGHTGLERSDLVMASWDSAASGFKAP